MAHSRERKLLSAVINTAISGEVISEMMLELDFNSPDEVSEHLRGVISEIDSYLQIPLDDWPNTYVHKSATETRHRANAVLSSILRIRTAQDDGGISNAAARWPHPENPQFTALLEGMLTAFKDLSRAAQDTNRRFAERGDMDIGYGGRPPG